MTVLFLLLIPIFAALLLGLVKNRNYASAISVICSTATFLLSVLLLLYVVWDGAFTALGDRFYVDNLSAYLVVLTAFIGFTTDLFHTKYLKNELLSGKLSASSLRFYPSLYQLFMFFMLLALLVNNLGVLWVAMEGATLATVILVSIYRSPASLEAAWKYIILCGVGITLALLGTVLLYFDAEKVLIPSQALQWTHLLSAKHLLSPEVLRISFIFIIVGYGTKVGLVPMHNWLPDAHGEGPASVSALLSGLLLNIAMYAVLRFKVIVDGAMSNDFTNHLLIGFGLLSILVAAFSMFKQRAIKRLFAYSSIEHMGLISFAFGLGTPLAVFAGMLHMSMHSLCKTSLFYAAGQAMQVRCTKTIDGIKGLVQDYPWLGWGLMLGALAIVGMPPFGLFVSELLILIATVQQTPILVAPLLIGIALSFAAILGKVQNMVFGEAPDQNGQRHKLSIAPIYLHMALVFLIGIIVPLCLWGWFQPISRLMLS